MYKIKHWNIDDYLLVDSKMKLVNVEKSTIAVMVFMACLSGAKAANTDTAFINTSPTTNIVIAIKGQDESAKRYDLDEIEANTHAISAESASRTTAVQDLQGEINNNKTDITDLRRDSSLQNAEITSNNQQIAILANNATQDKADQQAVNHALTDVNIHQDTMINDNTNRITALENKPKPKDGVNGKDGAKGDKDDRGERGLAGVNTTITKVDTATQAKVASNSKSLIETAKQSANVAKDLQDAKQFFNQQQASSNSQFKNLKDEVDDNKKESRSGAASAIAIASMPQVEAGQSVMFSAGAGTFKDEQALSVGASFHAGASTVIKAGVSDSTNNDFAMGAGIGIGF